MLQRCVVEGAVVVRGRGHIGGAGAASASATADAAAAAATVAACDVATAVQPPPLTSNTQSVGLLDLWTPKVHQAAKLSRGLSIIFS